MVISKESLKGQTPLEEKQAELNSVKELKQKKFVFEEEEDLHEKKEIFSIYGDKNAGKTTVCYGIPEPGDKVLVFSFDRKSGRPKELVFISESGITIKVYDAIKYLDRSSQDLYQSTCEITQSYVLSMLDQSREKYAPDWIVFDGTEDMSSIMEQVMRLRNTLRPYQGISNLSIWKERKQYLDDIHDKAVNIATKGVMYTMYSEIKELTNRDGTVVERKEIPKWIGSVMRETDVVIKVEIAVGKDHNKKFVATVVGSKLPIKYPDGEYNITDKRFRDVVCQQ